MSTPYTDLMIRDYFGDNGTPRSGTLSASPDIIPWGTEPLPDFQTYLTTQQAVNSDLGKDIVGYQDNYLFVRCLNLSSAAAAGKVYLYYSPSNLLMAPGLWSTNVLNTQNGAGYGVVSIKNTGDFGVGDLPFVWVPSPPPNNTHYCMVARLVTDQHPNPIPTNVATFNDFVSYIANNPGTAWRNVAFVGTAPDWSNVVPVTSLSADAQLYFQVQCTNVPIGSQVAFACPDPGTSPMINLQPTTISTNPNFSAGMWATVPANWTGRITLNWFSKGKTSFGPGASITLKCFYSPPGGAGALEASLVQHFRPAAYFGIQDQPPGRSGVGPTPIFNVGSMTHRP